jgi:hypothetical protein
MAKEVEYPKLNPINDIYAQARAQVLPRSISSAGMLPGTTVLRIGGDENVQIDGANRRILISDGTNNRVLIGYQSGGF